MEIVIKDTPLEAAAEAASRVVGFVNDTPSARIGLATGGTQQGIYQRLIEAARSGSVSFQGCRFFMLDEYVGVAHGEPTSFQRVLRDGFLDPVGIDPGRFEALDGADADLDREAARFEAALAEAGGIDLQLLGIGTNGHIGFNEPGSASSSRTRVVRLDQQTRQDNASYFPSLTEVPTHAITQGLGTIMEAQSILLVAKGEAKARAVAAMIEGPVDSACPASALQNHPRVTVVLDTAAASLLEGARLGATEPPVGVSTP